MKLQIEEFILKKALKTLIMNWTDTDPWMSEKLLIRGKSCFYYSILTLTNLRYSMFYTIPCLTRRCTDQITRHRQQKKFFGPYVYKIRIERWISNGSNEIEIRLSSYKFFLENIFDHLCTQVS